MAEGAVVEASRAVPGDVVGLVACLQGDAAALATAELDAVGAADAAELHQRLRETTDRLRAVAARLLAVVEEDGRWAQGGARTFPEWVSRQEGTSVGAARREAGLGRALADHLPATREAVATGSITLEHAEVLSRFGPTSDARRAALAGPAADRNEAHLIEQARRLPVDGYRRVVRRWAAQVDAAAAEREHERSLAKEHLIVSRRDDGVAVQGFLTAENGALLMTALRAVVGVPAADDERSPEQRSAAGLVGLARLVLDRGLAGGGAQVRPHLSVHVSWETLETAVRAQAEPGAAGATTAELETAGLPPAELETGEPLPMSTVRRLLCDSEVSRLVFGPEGHVLDVGRAQRTYGGQLRRAVVARDRTCRYPGCEAPPSLGEVHHVVRWSDGGPTSVANGVLLCWFHHDLVHRRRLRIDRSGSDWVFRRHDGSLLVARGRSEGVPGGDDGVGGDVGSSRDEDVGGGVGVGGDVAVRGPARPREPAAPREPARPARPRESVAPRRPSAVVTEQPVLVGLGG